MLLSEAIDALAIATRANGRSVRTVDSYLEKLSHLLDFLGDPLIDAVTVHDLRRFLVWQRDKGLSPFTIKSRARAIKRLFNFCQAEGIIAENPAERIEVPSPRREEPKGISWADFKALLETTSAGAMIDLRDRAIILFLADTGCRVGGLAGLEIGDVDLDKRRAMVTEKGARPRWVFFQEPTARALSAWLGVRPECGTDALFVTLARSAGSELTTQGVARMLARRGKASACEGPVNPHAFRHSFARAFLTSGGDLGTLSQILGHSSVAVTVEYYAIFTTEELQRQHDRYSPISQLEDDEDDKDK